MKYHLINGDIVWVDGDVSYSRETACERIFQRMPVQYLSDDQEIAKAQSAGIPVKKKHSIDKQRILDASKPRSGFSLKLQDFLTLIVEAMNREFERDDLSTEEKKQRLQRVKRELELCKRHQAFDTLIASFVIVNMLSDSGVVWGLGRGSSVSLYILYLLRVHDIDSVKYQLDPLEFFGMEENNESKSS